LRLFVPLIGSVQCGGSFALRLPIFAQRSSRQGELQHQQGTSEVPVLVRLPLAVSVIARRGQSALPHLPQPLSWRLGVAFAPHGALPVLFLALDSGLLVPEYVSAFSVQAPEGEQQLGFDRSSYT